MEMLTLPGVNHPVHPSCGGEKCSVCGAPAAHKMSEVIQRDSSTPLPGPRLPDETIGQFLERLHREDPHRSPRHEFTNYVCCAHFALILGPVPAQMCGVDRATDREAILRRALEEVYRAWLYEARNSDGVSVWLSPILDNAREVLGIGPFTCKADHDFNEKMLGVIIGHYQNAADAEMNSLEVPDAYTDARSYDDAAAEEGD